MTGGNFTLKSTFSEILSSLRREKNLSQRRAASDLGISQALLSHYENNAREPKLEFVVKACEYYDVSADYILGRTEARTDETSKLTRAMREIISGLEGINIAEADLISKMKKLAK